MAHSHVFWRTSVPTALSGAVLLSLAGLTAPIGHADGVDQAFLNAVKSKDINFASPQSALVAGHQVCNELDQGRVKSEVATDLTNTSNLDGYHAGYFVGLSIAAFCPRHHAG
ncbi:DUF732 domain-containing protein [Mycobacterium asiaticum]|uniref:DUF732 domain-containing protein n=1 Tax=Mycobacterium asiaticum TaxID=1790 RepID=A0A1A3N4F7_MYCAS|nr:DUF732 domain-containing protein [Mycobacterium asiaticum]OBK16686.1 hypothetical protein A5636_24985 [Mycobacterium asiaticum]